MAVPLAHLVVTLLPRSNTPNICTVKGQRPRSQGQLVRLSLRTLSACSSEMKVKESLTSLARVTRYTISRSKAPKSRSPALRSASSIF